MAQTRDRKDWLSSLQGVATRVEQLASQQQRDAHDLAAKVRVEYVRSAIGPLLYKFLIRGPPNLLFSKGRDSFILL